MATPPEKIPQRLTKDVREVIKEMSKAPFGRPGKVDKTKPKLTVVEAEQAKETAKKTPPLYIKKEPEKLTPKQIETRIKEISRERGISYNEAKELLRKELATPPKSTPVKQTDVVLSKAIPTRQEIEDVAPRAVTYRGRVIYLTPAQIKQLGLSIDYPETTFGNLFGEQQPKTQYERITRISPLTRQIKDIEAAKEETRLRTEALNDWNNQARAAASNPEVRNPAEALGKATPDSAKAEAYAERLFNKAYKELTPKERKSIKMIINTEARNAEKATTSAIGRQMDVNKVRRFVNNPFNPGTLGALNFVGLAANAFFMYRQLEEQTKQLKSEAMN